MPRGAKLTPEVEELIVEVCIKHPEWISKPKKIQQEVIRQLPDSLKVWGGPNWPGVDVIKDRLRKTIRPSLQNRPPESKRLDKPWSLGASIEHGIPPDANRDLFDIWRVSLAIDQPISIRQARWIVYLRTFFPYAIDDYSGKVSRNLRLVSQSWLYSIREQVSEIMGENYLATTALDSASFMSPWELNTAVKLGKVSEVEFPLEPLAKLEESGSVLTGPPRQGFSVEQAVWHTVRKEPPRDREIMELGFGEKALPEEADLVCAYCLNYLSKGPKWESLNYSQQKEIRLKLLEWVTNYSELLSNISPLLTPSELSTEEIIENSEIPPDILRMVGYDVPDTSSIEQKTEGGTK